MTWEDGVLLSTNGDVAERAAYKKGVVTFGRFLRVRGEGGDDVWKLNHAFTLSADSTGSGMALVTDHILRSVGFAREVAEERVRQHLAFPNEERGLPDGTGGAARDTWETIARNSCDRASREGRLTHAHILEEESCEVLAASDPTKLRAELVQLAAVCAGWIEDLDRRETAGVPVPSSEEAA